MAKLGLKRLDGGRRDGVEDSLEPSHPARWSLFGRRRPVDAVTAPRFDRAERLGAEWQYLEAVGDDVAPLLVGPGGVISVHCERLDRCRMTVYPSAIVVDGDETNHLVEVRSRARATRLELSQALGWAPHVRAVLVVSGTKSPTVKQMPDDVSVVLEGEVARAVRKLPAYLSAAQAASVVEAARRTRHWR